MNTELEEVKTQLTQADTAFGKMSQENASLKSEVGAMKNKLQQAKASFRSISAESADGKKTINMLEDRWKREKQYDRRRILENKAVQGTEILSESKRYRMWNRKLKNVLEQCRRSTRKTLMWLHTVTEQAVNDEHDAVHDPMDAKVTRFVDCGRIISDHTKTAR